MYVFYISGFGMLLKLKNTFFLKRINSINSICVVANLYKSFPENILEEEDLLENP